jgi:DNA-binding transcriptional regulator YiaG
VHDNLLANLFFQVQSEDMKAKKKVVARRRAKANGAAGWIGFHHRNGSGTAVRDITDRFGVRQETLSRMTGFSQRAVAEWASGKEPSAPAKRAFVEMDRLLDGLASLMQPKEVGRWLKEPNPAFDGSTPVQVIERGQLDRVWRMLYYTESGEPG